MKRLTVLFLLVLAAGRLFSVPGGAPPPHDARFLKVEITYTLNADGSWDKEYRHQVRLDTYYAVNRALGETFILYNPDYQKLEILKSETTMAGGRKVASPPNAFNEVLPFAAHGCADFSGLREMVVTHTGLERGAVIDLHYRLHTRAGFLPAFSGREALSRDFPVDAYALAIVVPLGRKLSYQFFGKGAQAMMRSDADQRTDRYDFFFQDPSPSPREPLMHPQAEPFVVFAEAADWKGVLALPGDDEPLPAPLLRKIEEWKARFAGKPELLAALQRLVATEFSECPLGLDATGWKARPVARVAASHYGTRLEKALLLRALLVQCGVEAEVLAVAGDAFSRDVPSMLQVQEFWVKSHDGIQAAYLDPCHEQDEFFPYRWHGLDACHFRSGEWEKLPACDWSRSGIDVSGTMRLDAAKSEGDLVVAVRGALFRYNEAAADGSSYIAAVLRKFFPVEKAEVKKILALSRGEMRAEVTCSGPWLKEAAGGYFTVPALGLPGLAPAMTEPERRAAPMLLDPPFQVALDLELQPAAGLRWEYVAPAAQRDQELYKVGYFYRRSSRTDEGRLRFRQGYGIERSLQDADAYSKLRSLFLPEFAPGHWLVLKK